MRQRDRREAGHFNPRSREGSDCAKLRSHTTPIDFNPRSREGSDALHNLRSAPSCYFNPRSREGSDQSVGRSDYNSRFQSTLPRRERLLDFLFHREPAEISIHAPAKGATCKTVLLPSALQHFNPRSREGSDLVRLSLCYGCIGISIHAPAKGATRAHRGQTNNTTISIHAPAKGATI